MCVARPECNKEHLFICFFYLNSSLLLAFFFIPLLCWGENHVFRYEIDVLLSLWTDSYTLCKSKGYQNKKKKKELTNAFEKLSKSSWKSTEKLDSIANSRDIRSDHQQLSQPHESDVTNLSVHQRRKSFVMSSAKPKPKDEKVRKSASVYNGK